MLANNNKFAQFCRGTALHNTVQGLDEGVGCTEELDLLDTLSLEHDMELGRALRRVCRPSCIAHAQRHHAL